MQGPSRHVVLSRGYRLGGRYQLLFPYATGGMATVWLARVRGKHGFEKLYAIKTILPHLASDEVFRNMFLDEAGIASRLKHANVAAIEDLGEDAGVLYMVLEWIQGDPWSRLNAAIKATGDAIPYDIMLRLAAGTCAGLQAAHELRDDAGALLNVVHRDVSPQNVLVTDTGVVKVIDFGVAKAVGRRAGQTRAGLIKGKVAYMAPEQASGGAVDRRADIWGVGAILYELLAGRTPFEAESDVAFFIMLAAGKPPAPLPSTVPRAIADVVRRALMFAPSQRFETALEMQRAIEAAMTAPVTSDDVAACLQHYLGPRIAERNKAIAEALDDANEQSMIGAVVAEGFGGGETRTPAEPFSSRNPEPAVTAPTIPAPAAVPVSSPAAPPPASAPASLPEVATAKATASAVVTHVRRGELRPLRAIHVAWVVAITLVTLVVWTLAIRAALHARNAAAPEQGEIHGIS